MRETWSSLLTLTVGLGGGYDSSILIGEVPAGDESPPENGPLEQLAPATAALRRCRLWDSAGGAGQFDGVWSRRFELFPGTLARVAPGIDDHESAPTTPHSNDTSCSAIAASSQVRYRLWSGASFAAYQTIGYQPFYSIPGFPGASSSYGDFGSPVPVSSNTPYQTVSTAPNQILASDLANHLSMSSNAIFSQRISKRVSLSANYFYHGSDSPSEARNLVNQSAGRWQWA